MEHLPVLTSNLAGAVNESMFLEILDEQKLMVSFRTYRGMRYAVFPMYFDYRGSGTGWLDSFAQGKPGRPLRPGIQAHR